jgi:hypothetical protein
MTGAFDSITRVIELKCAARQRCPPGQTRVGQLLPGRVAQHDVLTDEAAHLGSLVMKRFVFAGREAGRGRQGLQRHLQAREIAVDLGGDPARRRSRLLLEPGALRLDVTVGQHARERQRWYQQGSDEQDEMGPCRQAAARLRLRSQQIQNPLPHTESVIKARYKVCARAAKVGRCSRSQSAVDSRTARRRAGSFLCAQYPQPEQLGQR